MEEEVQPVVLFEASEIKNYVVSLCEQMIDISREMEEVRSEYDNVTEHIKDIQIVENLEGPQKDQLVDVATNIAKLTKVRNDYVNAEHKISEETFNQMDEEEAQLPGIIKRLQSNETYLNTIKKDLNHLAAEKVEWSVLRQERRDELEKLQKLSRICLFAGGGLALGVAILSVSLQWDMFPIMLVAFLAVLVGSYIVIRMQDCNREIHKADVNQNRAIVLENRVKIKYVNIKNAVDYTCQRFHVHNSQELTYMYELYIEACKEREKFKQTNEDLEYFNRRLLRMLHVLHLSDVKIWLNYATAIAEPKEMVEVKHDYFARRFSLRTRIEYNLNAIENMKNEVLKYHDRLGNIELSDQIRTILQRVEEINKGMA